MNDACIYTHIILYINRYISIICRRYAVYKALANNLINALDNMQSRMIIMSFNFKLILFNVPIYNYFERHGYGFRLLLFCGTERYHHFFGKDRVCWNSFVAMDRQSYNIYRFLIGY